MMVFVATVCFRFDRVSLIFTALHGMQTRSSDEFLSVRLFVRLSHA